ncbi:unnamed protein product [Ectocarpus fasciculatus]
MQRFSHVSGCSWFTQVRLAYHFHPTHRLRLSDALLPSPVPQATKASCANMDQKIGVEIIEKALRMPVHTIAMNAGVEGAVVVGELLKTEDPQWGHNAATGEYCDMIQAGIIDPTKVVRTALVDAQSVAALLMTAEAMVTDLPEEEAPAPPMGGGGMGGGMGGMGGMPGMM